jgi:hypothetical protein
MPPPGTSKETAKDSGSCSIFIPPARADTRTPASRRDDLFSSKMEVLSADVLWSIPVYACIPTSAENSFRFGLACLSWQDSQDGHNF